MTDTGPARWVTENRELRALNTEMLQALAGTVPANLCTTNTNIPDSMIVPMEVTMGELRAIRAIISKATQS